MRKLVISLVLAICFAIPAFSQYAYRIVPAINNPTNCNPATGDIVWNTTNLGLYVCTATDTWTPAGFLNNVINLTQGTLTASTPAIATSATWNNGAVAFENFTVNITNTASAAGTTLLDFSVGGASIFEILPSGSTNLAAGAGLRWLTRSQIYSAADGRFTLWDSGGTTFSRLTLGPESVAGTGLINDIVGGQTQGIIIGNGDGTTVSFAELGAATNGAIVYCDDCTKATPCAGAGNGALAKRLNGAWDCD